MKNKKSMQIETMIVIFAIVIGGILLFIAARSMLTKSSGGALETIKKWAGYTSESDLEKQKEQERVDKEWQSNAEIIFFQFENEMKHCQGKISGNLCRCFSMDFVNLNDYTLKISDNNGAKILELFNSESVLVDNKKSEIGNFYLLPIGPRDTYEPPGIKMFNTIQSDPPSVVFSKNSVTFKNTVQIIEKLKGSMQKVAFLKMQKGETISGKPLPIDTILISEDSNGYLQC